MDRRISSTDNPRVKLVLRLRHRRGRQRQDRTLIDGAREVVRALEAGIELLDLFVRDPLPESDLAQSTLNRVLQSGLTPWRVSEQVFRKMAYGDRADGFLAVARPVRKKLSDLALPDDALVVVLEQVEKPGNVGAVIRTADAAGLSAVILADTGSDPYNPNTIRASLGTVFALPTVDAPAADVLVWLRREGFRIVASRTDAGQMYSGPFYAGRTAIVLGSESSGLSPVWQGHDITAVSLPMRGSADSLNVSAAAAVLCYEAERQRRQQSAPPATDS